MPRQMLARAAAQATGRAGWLRSATGGLLAIALASWFTQALMGWGPITDLAMGGAAAPWLIAPVGASAVLVFALPASPLAQPWAVAGGDLISMAVGLGFGWIVPDPAVAAAMALAGAIAAMSLLRCLHPPGGACALLGALGAHAGWDGMLLALACNLAVLLMVAWLFNTMTGHAWPHRKAIVAAPAAAAAAPAYAAADLDAVLEDWDEVLDVSREDLDALFRAVERRVQARAAAAQETGGSTNGTR